MIPHHTLGEALARPSDPLLRWLRKTLQERRMSAPALAEKAGLDRARLRHVLAGAESMTVDELLAISRVLDLSPADFGALPDEEPMPAVVDEPGPVLAADDDEEAGIPYGLDPLGNHPRQLFEVAFALGCDFLFFAKSAELSGSGVPASVLDRYADRDLPIKLDAAYHQYNAPRYDEGGVTLALSFDALYECRFPWTSIRQVIFYPAPPPAPVADDEDDDEPAPPKKPFLRLVE
jgi:transcriptional regulator with XRE-family HTH domain